MQTEHSRDRHKTEVVSFLQKNVADLRWEIERPSHGTGQETYLAWHDGGRYFIKLGAKTERYQVMSDLGLSPKVITTGSLEDGTSVLVQGHILGRNPTRKDFHQYLREFARGIRLTHQSQELRQILPGRTSSWYRDVGLETLAEIEGRWEKHKSKVVEFAEYVDQSIQYLQDQVAQFNQSGLVASHNDVCNGNWLVSLDGKIYLIDYESMSLDDPALDLGAILWWYYPPVLREEFLSVAGYKNDQEFRHRMRIRMAMHNLNIIIPRQDSFDRFSADTFDEALVDFRAVMQGEENPQGYED